MVYYPKPFENLYSSPLAKLSCNLYIYASNASNSCAQPCIYAHTQQFLKNTTQTYLTSNGHSFEHTHPKDSKQNAKKTLKLA